MTTTDHTLDTEARPAACSCGKFQAAGSPTFVRGQFAVHLADIADLTTTPRPNARGESRGA